MNCKLLALLCCSFAACATPRAASVAPWKVDSFEVHAYDETVGQCVLAALPDARRAVALLPGLRPTGVARIDVGPFGPTELLGYTCFFPDEPGREGQIAIASDADSWYMTDERVSATLAHELTHFSLGPEWGALPAVLEEGLCNWVATRAAPGIAPEDRLCVALCVARLMGGEAAVEVVLEEHLLDVKLHRSAVCEGLAEVPEMLALGRFELWSSRWSERADELYALGHLLVQRIGVTRLHQLCIAARERGLELIPASEVLAAAGLPLDRPELWWASVLAMTGTPERAGLVTWLSGSMPGFDLRLREEP